MGWLCCNYSCAISLRQTDEMKAAIIGSGSWATALAKMWTDKGQSLHWWIRNPDACEYLATRHHNRDYLSSVNFDPELLQLSTDLTKVVDAADLIIMAVPSAYITDVLDQLEIHALKNKWILSAIKGIVPGRNILLNEYLSERFSVPDSNYFAVLGPCHAEEVVAEKLSYLTFSGSNISRAAEIAGYFKSSYINTIVNEDINGVQYAAVGDLLVTCYSPYSGNRSFGTMIGKGYSVRTAQLEMNMVAEGLNAARCVRDINMQVKADMPIATAIYSILWENVKPALGFKQVEQVLV